jgi:hypothetical protein
MQATVVGMKARAEAKETTQDVAVQEHPDGESGDAATAEPPADGGEAGKGRALRQLRSKRVRNGDLASGSEGLARDHGGPKCPNQGALPAVAAAAGAVELG